MGTNLRRMEAGCTRDHLLANAGLIFLSEEGWQDLIREITRLAAEELADCVHARLLAEDGRLVHEEYAHSPNVPPDLSRRLGSEIARNQSETLDLVFEFGGPILLPVAELSTSGREVQSAMAVAIASAERSYGTLTLISTRLRYGPEDLALAAELGRRTGQALKQENRYLSIAKWRQGWTEELATIAHDLRSPLNVVRLTAGMLMERFPEDEFATAWLERIETAVQRMEHMIADILESVRAETAGPKLELRTIRACSVLREVVELNDAAAQRKSVLLHTHYPEATVSIRADLEAMVRAVSNVVSNAVKFSPVGGRIDLAVERRPGSVSLRVSDEGPGIPEEHLPFVFDRYWRAPDQPHGGVGLGLYIAKSLVEAHGDSAIAVVALGWSWPAQRPMPAQRTRVRMLRTELSRIAPRIGQLAWNRGSDEMGPLHERGDREVDLLEDLGEQGVPAADRPAASA